MAKTRPRLRISLPEYRCLRCGHVWHPKKPQVPTRCAACGDPYYDRPRILPRGRRAGEMDAVPMLQRCARHQLREDKPCTRTSSSGTPRRRRSSRILMVLTGPTVRRGAVAGARHARRHAAAEGRVMTVPGWVVIRLLQLAQIRGPRRGAVVAPVVAMVRPTRAELLAFSVAALVAVLLTVLLLLHLRWRCRCRPIRKRSWLPLHQPVPARAHRAGDARPGREDQGGAMSRPWTMASITAGFPARRNRRSSRAAPRSSVSSSASIPSIESTKTL